MKRSAGIPATPHEYRAALFEKPIVNIRKGILEASQSILFQVLEYGHLGIWTYLHRDWERLQDLKKGIFVFDSYSSVIDNNE